MPNPFLGIITSEMKTLFTNAIDALLEDDACMVPCTLIFGDTRWTDCSNCVFDAARNRSSNKYQAGGPILFNHGVCPYCHGVGGFPLAANTETVYLMPLWDYKEWIDWQGSSEKSRSAAGLVQTISKMSTISNLKRAKEVIINTTIEKYTHHRFTRHGEPTPCGFGNDAYIFTMWSHVE